MNIVIVGIGYVGLSNAVLLAKCNNVILLDIDKYKVDLINDGKLPIKDSLMKEYIRDNDIRLTAILSSEYTFKDCDYVVVATSTNYNENTNCFDTSSVESVISEVLKYNKESIIIIKSTIPVGYTNILKNKFNTDNIIFSPEFLREGKALYDNLYPSRIIIGEKSIRAEKIANLFKKSILKDNTEILFMNPDEAECVKLFSNAYLAMRVGFFNELDTYAKFNNLNAKDIINGVCADPRIGNYYNNPSFGYGGYCLPKDTKQLLTNFKNIPNSLIKATVDTNKIRKENIINLILSKNSKNIGIYRLLMKKDSDNFRNSVMLDIIDYIKQYKDIIIYEPLIDCFDGCVVNNNLENFLSNCDLIVANRIDDDIIKYKNKIFTADIFSSDN